METEYKPTKNDWINFKSNNINLIINNQIQIQTALSAIALCDEKIKEFPEEIKEEIIENAP